MSKRNHKSSKRRLDFLSNRQNKYSIRKFTVGTASILIGTLLIFGSHQEVEAAETEEQTEAVNASKVDEADSVDSEVATDSPEVVEPAPTEPSLEAAAATEQNESDVSKDTTPSIQAPSDEVTASDQATEQPESEGNVNEETEQPTEATSKDQEEKQAPSETSDEHVEDVVQHHEQAVDDVKVDSNDQSEPVPSKYEQQEDTQKASVDLSQEYVKPDPEVESSIPVVTPATQPDTANEAKDKDSTVEQEGDISEPEQVVSSAETYDVTAVQSTDLNELTPSEVSAALKDLANEQEQSKVKAVAPQLLSRAVREPNAPYGNHRVDTMKRAEVNDFQSFVNALNDKRVQTIVLNQDITARRNAQLKDGVGRYILVEGNNHTINSGRYYVEALPNSGCFDITFKNANIQTNNDKGLIYFNRSKHDNQELTFENVTHTGHSLVNGKSNVDVNLVGHFTTISNDNHASRSNIAAKSIIVSDDAVIKGQRTGLGNVFEVDKYGEFLTGSNANISVDVSPVDAFKHTNGHTAFKLNQGARVIFGNHSNVQITGQNIFSFSDYGRLQTGQGSLIRVKQKGNGNIVDMGRNSGFVVGQRSQFLATSDEHRTPGSNYEENNLIGLDGNSEIIIEESAKLVLDAKNHQWNTKTKSQSGYYNDLVNINAKGQETALLHVKDNATLDLRTDNRNYYAEVISIPLSGNHPDRKFIFDHAYYVNLQKTNIVVSGESVKPVGKKPNLIFMSPKSPGHFQWNGSYIVKMWNPTHLSDPDQHADADNVWGNVVDLRAEQEGCNTGVPTYNREQSTNLSNQGKALSQLNLNYAQRLVLISNQSEHPEAVNPDNTEHFVEIHDDYNPTYNEAATKPGQPVDLPVVFVEEERASRAATPPEGTVFEIVRDKVPPGWNASVKPNGTLQVIPPADAIPGTTAVIPVKVTFPDGTVTYTSGKVLVLPTDAHLNSPTYGGKETKPGVPVDVPQTGDTDMPDGTVYEVPSLSIPEGWTVTVKPDGTLVVTPPADAEPGTTINIPVNVTYPDKSVDYTAAKVTVIPNDAHNNNPGYNEGSTKLGQPVTVPQTGDETLPPGTTFEVPNGSVPPGYTVTVDPNGNVTVTPPTNATPGTSVDIPVKVAYPDGSVDNTKVKVTVIPNDAQSNEPGYGDVSTKPGQPVTVPQVGDTDLPPGTTFEVPNGSIPPGYTVTIDPNGNVTVTPPVDATPGTSLDIPVKVTYPDGSTEEVPVKVGIVPNDAQSNDPGYGDVSTKPGKPITVPQTGDETLPPGTTFEVPEGSVPPGYTVTIDPNGNVTVTPPVDATPGTSVDIPVKVTYPDGSVDNTKVKVTVIPNDAQSNEPGYGDVSTKPGQPVTVPQTGDETLPSGTTFEVPEGSVPPSYTVTVDPNGNVTVTPPVDATPGTSVDIPVKVTYPDGSVDDTKVKVTVIPNDAQSNDPGYGDVSTNPGKPVTVPQTGDETLPPGTTFEVPEGSIPPGYTVTIDPNGNVTVTPPVDATPGTSVDIPVKVTYPDGSVDNSKVKVTVIPNDAQSNDPGYGDVSTKPGQPVMVSQTGDETLPPGTTFEIPNGSVPPSYTVTVDTNGNVTVTPPADATPGTSVDIPVKVTYPDGSVDNTKIKVTITPNDAQSNDPGYGDVSTKPGQPVTVPQTGDTDLPPGTTFEVPNGSVPPGYTVTVDPNGNVTVTPPVDATPGTSVDIPVKVTYPDGSVDNTKVKVTITPNDAQSNDPGYGDVSTKPGQPVTVPQTGDETLPPGTTFEVPNGSVPPGYTVTVDPNGNVTVTPPADATPGTSVDIPVKVTYPDGSTEEVPVKVGIVPNDAQSNEPGYGDVSTKPGQPVTVPQTGDETLPPGTTFEVPNGSIPSGYTVMVDPNGNVTVTPPADAIPGTSVDIPVKVTYPDGSVDNTKVKVTVIPNDAQSNEPGYGDVSTKPGRPVTVPQTGDETLPPGTTFEVPEGSIPPGYTVTVDPNGNVTITPPADATPGISVDIPVKITYPDGSTEEVPVKVTIDTPDKGETSDNGTTPDPGKEPDKGETSDSGMTSDPGKEPDKGETPDNGMTPDPGKEPDKDEIPDSGMTPDPGNAPDKGETPDSGMTPDPGNEPDKGETPDNGMTPDPGNAPDKGETPDSGMTPDPGKEPDKGETPDNGTNPDPGKEPDKGGTPDNGMTPDPGKEPDKGETPDSGMTPDPGIDPDKGETPDSGMTPDSGKEPDKGETPDNGMTPDPGNDPDKGETSDSGMTPDPGKEPDKGETPDSGMTPDPGKEPDKGETPDNDTNPDPGKEPDKGETPDNGMTPNPGKEPDKGETPDNGMTPNPGKEPDKGETPDSGMTPDPGKEPDKGETPDNGITPDPGNEPDKGETPDNGTTQEPGKEPDKGETPDNGMAPNPGKEPDKGETPDNGMTPDPGNAPDKGETPDPDREPNPESPKDMKDMPNGNMTSDKDGNMGKVKSPNMNVNHDNDGGMTGNHQPVKTTDGDYTMHSNMDSHTTTAMEAEMTSNDSKQMKSKAHSHSSMQTMTQLPETGESQSHNGALYGGLLAGLGALLLAYKRKKEDES
ncbi:YPDG domain-containing protein [Staphylococcus auricularis]|uniref:YPDG domain-containing protein n=1 Tax=Staphylococcus auricularis TaxID=29379 RepID=UPI002DBEAC78|nr:YPDG domain-containing protein [Staphylococcus auricularis]MEB6570674.1 YPDG domain-containing protein [Staphylococcus auricularis]